MTRVNHGHYYPERELGGPCLATRRIRPLEQSADIQRSNV